MSVELPEDPASPPWEDGDARSHYRNRLRRLDLTLLAIAQEVADATEPACEALLAGDRDLAGDVRVDNATRRERCRMLEDECFVLIAREAPVAADLREVVAIIRAITDLERSSKLLVHIVETLDRVHPPSMEESLRSALVLLADSGQRIFCSGVQAWRDRDGLAVNELEELDDEVDRLQEGLLAELYGGGNPVEDVVAVSLLGRYFERLADHGVALARHVSWAITGDRVRETPWSA